MLVQFKLHFILTILDLYITIHANNYNILQRKLTSWAQRDTALQKNITLTDQRKSLIYSNPEHTL